MKYVIDGQEFNVVIERKHNKRMYLRVKENMDISVTCPILTPNKLIETFIKENEDKIKKIIKRFLIKKEKQSFFYYLGQKYDLVYLNNDGIVFGQRKVFVNSNFDLDKWYKSMAKDIFQEEFDKIYHEFKYEIPFPSLHIRKMKTRWGVCNVKLKKVTLNLELIKKDKKYLDYVIVHELCHLIEANHSKRFWNCVEENMPDYKKIRKELKDDE